MSFDSVFSIDLAANYSSYPNDYKIDISLSFFGKISQQVLGRGCEGKAG
jgi:hypothetical protein